MKFLLIASFPLTISMFRGNLIKEIELKAIEVHVTAPFEMILEMDENK